VLNRLGFRSRLFVILALFAFVPAIVLTVAWGGTIAGFLGRMDGTAAWENAATTGREALEVARKGARTAADSVAVAAHERELATSLTNAERFGFLSRRAIPALLLLGTLLLGVLTYVASRVAGHLSRQLSRPLMELVGWTAMIRRGEKLPQSEGRGAPEFEMLRYEMRQMEAGLETGRRAAVEAERLAAFRESARQVAHELKNPLTPIRFAVDTLKRKVGPELSEVVEVLASESARLEAMARSFAQFGRLPDGPVAEVDVGELVRAVTHTTVPAHVSCEVEAAGSLPRVAGQNDALSRALSNVLLNAIEASPSDPRLSVRVSLRERTDGSEGRWVAIAVRDNGIGIEPERLERIWDPYHTDKTAGTGLGLAIVKQTVTAHGGSVEAESTPGVGTEIRIVLPAIAGR
jgi:two-component system nitrogen regulation sensor histidine kinase NtrY